MGVGTSSIAWDDLERRVGAPLESRRLYRQSELTGGLSTLERENVTAGRQTVVSWQPTSVDQREALVEGSTNPAIETWLGDYPPDADVVAIMGHEPTAHNKRLIWPDASTYLAGVDRFWEALRAVNKDRDRRIRLWGCHIPWHARTGETRGWFSEKWRGCAWDGYDWFGTCPDPSGIYGTAFQQTHDLGLRVAIAEFGSDLVNDDTGRANTGRAEWIGRVRDYAESNEAAFVLYWDNSNWLLKTDAEFKALTP
jgi:hypothetical protein